MIDAIAVITKTRLKGNEYVLFLLEEIRKISDRLTVCLPEGIEAAFSERIMEIADQSFQCEGLSNVRKWNEALKKMKPDLSEHVLFFDDTCLGPLYPADVLKESFLNSGADFWGLYLNRVEGCEDNEGRPISSVIPLNFFGLSKEILSDPRFCSFLDEILEEDGEDNHDYSLDPAPARRFADRFFEEKLFAKTEEWGLKWSVFIEDSVSVDSRYYMPVLLYDTYRLISEEQYPFLPLAIYDLRKEEIRTYSIGYDAKRCLDYVEKQTDFDEKLLYDYLISTKDPSELAISLNLRIILSSLETKEHPEIKGAVFAYLFYEDLFESSIQKLKNVPEHFTIYIATDQEEKKKRIEGLVAKAGVSQKVEVLLHTHKGRDLAALLVLMRPFLNDYEIICFVHDKKSSQMLYPTVGADFNEQIWNCTLRDPGYVRGIIEYFAQNPRAGFLGSPMVEHGMYFHTSIESWTICFQPTLELMERLNIQAPISGKTNPLSLGSAFWCRTEAMEKLFTYPFTYEDFPDEPMPVDGSFSHCLERIFPYAAADAGFYSATVMDCDTASSLLTAKETEHVLLMRKLIQVRGINAATMQTAIDSVYRASFKRKRVIDISQLDANQYRYGAFQRNFSKAYFALYGKIQSNKAGRKVLEARRRLKRKLFGEKEGYR